MSSDAKAACPPSHAKKRQHPLQHLLAGGVAGFVESSCCHPLDTIKTNMQLHQQRPERVLSLQPSLLPPVCEVRQSGPSRKIGKLNAQSTRLTRSVFTAASDTSLRLGPVGTARRIIELEGPMALYKGMTAVWTGIIPKMAIRFVSFECYRDNLLSMSIFQPTTATFVAGLTTGVTEAVLVVTPAEVCKIRMQAQNLYAKETKRKYTNVLQTAYTIVRDEGLWALYKGVVPTMMRQGCNQAANFTAYGYSKKQVSDWQLRNGGSTEVKPWQHLLIGGLSSSLGPTVNNPLDVVKTRMQKQIIVPGEQTKYKSLAQSCALIAKEEGALALWKGLTPRLLRIMPGQAITFMTYESVSKYLTGLCIT